MCNRPDSDYCLDFLCYWLSVHFIAHSLCLSLLHFRPRSLMTESYDKEAALVQQDRPSRRKLQRAGEAVLEGGQWRVNDEMASSVVCSFVCASI